MVEDGTSAAHPAAAGTGMVFGAEATDPEAGRVSDCHRLLGDRSGDHG